MIQTEILIVKSVCGQGQISIDPITQKLLLTECAIAGPIRRINGVDLPLVDPAFTTATDSPSAITLANGLLNALTQAGIVVKAG